MKLLCVDGEPVYQEIISLCAQKEGMEVVTASSYEEAIQCYEVHKPDLVTLEVVIQGGSGVQLASALKRMDPGRFVPIIFLTSHISDSVMNSCFKAGADDFIPKPFNEMLFSTRVSTHKRQIHLIQEMYRKNRELTFYQSMIEREHKMAHQVLDHILTRSERSSQHLAITRLSATNFNGDLALAYTQPDGTRVVFVGDFTGHGLSASIGALPVAQAFFDGMDNQIGLSELATQLNKILLNILPDYMFCAAYMIQIQPSGEIEYWGGGMPRGYIRRGDDSVDYICSHHMPLGILSVKEFEADCEKAFLGAKDTLVVASDGIVELKNSDHQMLGEKAMEALVMSSYIEQDLNQAQSAMEAHLTRFQGKSEQLDDITLVAIRNT
ncbi:SpoIIE family protein phosphatase [Marinomonas pollencensis]|uniref:Response regulator receiver domain-containing protein n=1 Tax=Marinomonas pollencensis TaxID=491954 RepID=A0A3E0DVM9_9GAMM|nr:SpoIIE family protein phosphatase [Marinomonas pollencensis]REG85699.1 response regulator receiver domain-containing protein [Marinomonas pollencensis]